MISTRGENCTTDMRAVSRGLSPVYSMWSNESSLQMDRMSRMESQRSILLANGHSES